MIYASFWKRFNAYGYDFMIVQLLALGFMFLFFTFPTLEQFTMFAAEVDIWFDRFTNAILVISAAYNILLVASPKQATLGKAYCGVRVVNADGSRLSLLQSAIRHAASGIGAATGGLGFLTVLFTREKLAVHDMICNTRVIRIPSLKEKIDVQLA